MNFFDGYPINASALLLIVLLIQWNLVESQSCSNFVTRREWSELSSSDKNKCKARHKSIPYNNVKLDINAIWEISRRRDSFQSTDPSRMSYQDFVYIHYKNAAWVHGNALFYPFHRTMMKVFEDALCSAGYCSGIPYINWFDNDLLSNSDLWNWFGHITPDTRCLSDGSFKGFKIDNGSCLSRCGSRGIVQG